MDNKCILKAYTYEILIKFIFTTKKSSLRLQLYNLEMGKDKKKKGKGMEKTLAKTEKKLEKNFKKELKEIGEV